MLASATRHSAFLTVSGQAVLVRDTIARDEEAPVVLIATYHTRSDGAVDSMLVLHYRQESLWYLFSPSTKLAIQSQ